MPHISSSFIRAREREFRLTANSPRIFSLFFRHCRGPPAAGGDCKRRLRWEFPDRPSQNRTALSQIRTYRRLQILTLGHS